MFYRIKYHENIRDCFFCEAFEFQILGTMDKLAYGQIFSMGSYAQISLFKNHGISNTQVFDFEPFFSLCDFSQNLTYHLLG